MKTVPTGAKVAWVSLQNKNGWSLGLTFSGAGDRTLWLRNLRFKNEREVERAVKSAVHLIPLNPR